MGLDSELEFEKYCKVVESHKTGRRSHRNGSKADARTEKGKHSTRTSRVSLGENFTEISFSKSLSSSCKSLPFGPDAVSGNESCKRGSVYQTSEEVRRMKEMGAFEVREKIELSSRSNTSAPFRIIDSLSQPDEAIPVVEKKLSRLSRTGNSNMKSLNFIEHGNSLFLRSAPADGNNPSNGFFEIHNESKEREHSSAETIVRGSAEQAKLRCDHVTGPLNDGNLLSEGDTALNLPTSSSEHLGIPYSHADTGGDHSKVSSRTRFSQFRRMLDPFMKSKSQRNPSISVEEVAEVKTIKRSKTVCQTLVKDFSNKIHEMDTGVQFVEKDHAFDQASSPAHLHGLLNLEFKHGVPFFEFSLNDSEDVLAANTWKAENAFNWVYTFHSLNNRRKSYRNSWGTKERQKESSLVGQMQVSSYLCSELRNNGAFDNSMMTEFVVYDLAHARKCPTAQESSDGSTNPSNPIKVAACENNQMLESRQSSGNDDLECAASCPWLPADLLPNLETVAMVIQVPFEKRESLKDKREEGVSGHPNLLDLSRVSERSSEISSRSRENMKVVIPSGTHGLPTTEEGGGPTPLLDRWKSNGHCDCGGWDMACPLLVFDSPHRNIACHSSMENKWPSELFLKGAKEKVPALTIRIMDDGKYSVDFHAQLSKLQAFAISVAMLHISEGSTIEIGEDKEKQRLQCNSLKVMIEEEVRFLIEAVAEEEKKKITAKKLEETPPSYVLNPPFSPIGRV